MQGEADHSRETAFDRAPHCPGGVLTRRAFLERMAGAATAAAGTGMAWASGASEAEGPVGRAPTSIGLCKRYEYREVRRALGRMLDEIGGVRSLVRRRHVVVKLNLVNTSAEDVGGVPLWLTVTTHPIVAMALGSLLVESGARRVTFCDQLPFRALDEEAFAGYGYDARAFNQALDGRARFENTRNRGRHRQYAWVRVPGGELASAWEVNRTYVETDVLVSLGKLKSHISAGVTGGMKNLFGVPPSSLYSEDLDDEPDEDAVGYRSTTLHSCVRRPFTSAESVTGRSIEGDHGYNVPRFIVDLAAAFPIDLVVIDGISTLQTAEGWWIGSMVSVTRPGLLIAGRNPVCTDAVAAAVMGFNPDAPDRTFPFVNGANHLALARRRGLGENRLDRLEIAGVGLEAARFEFHPTYQRVQG
ncbi:MAG TPA: DUF362 domain-containing protein [Candidatus Paceibacterota bacterium]|nr:DUF362 domain-containing protein [Candidatus Paceibacterota bacterium]